MKKADAPMFVSTDKSSAESRFSSKLSSMATPALGRASGRTKTTTGKIGRDLHEHPPRRTLLISSCVAQAVGGSPEDLV